MEVPLTDLDSIAHRLGRTIGYCANLNRIALFLPKSSHDDAVIQMVNGELQLKLSTQTEALLNIFKEVHDNVMRQVREHFFSNGISRLLKF